MEKVQLLLLQTLKRAFLGMALPCQGFYGHEGQLVLASLRNLAVAPW